MKKEIYNLEFRSWCDEINIFGYKFNRIDDYQDRLAELQHFITVSSDFTVNENLCGKHSITAYVDIPDSESRAVIGQVNENNKQTALKDILLLLSLFTGRDVFTVDEKLSGINIITADPRQYGSGSVLKCSMPYKNKPIPDDEPFGYDIGFEEGINQVYTLIRSEDWQYKYKRGQFLYIAQQAFRRQSLETAFIGCWTIWEHLFSIINNNWLSDEQIVKIGAFEKIAFLLVEYALKKEINNSERERIKTLSNIRNRLIHFGRFPDNVTNEDAIMFINLTEFIITKILGLFPYGAPDTMVELEDFLKKSNKIQ